MKRILVPLLLLVPALAAPAALAQTSPALAQALANQSQGGAQASSAASSSPLTFGAAYYLLGTVPNNNTAFTTTAGFGTPTQSTVETDFPSSFASAAALWVGYNFGPVGFRGRYYFEAEHQAPALATLTAAQAAAGGVIAPPPGVTFNSEINFGSPGVLLGNGIGTDSLSLQRTLDVHVVDLEAFFQPKLGSVQAVLSAGGRYMDLSQTYVATLGNIVTPNVLAETQFLSNDRKFYGGGGTAAFELQAPIFAIVYGYAIFRGSVVLGNQQEIMRFAQVVTDTGGAVGGPQNNTNSSNANHFAVIPVLECEAGLQIGQSLGGFPISIRAGVVSQTYFNAGSPTSTSGNLNVVGAQFSLIVTY